MLSGRAQPDAKPFEVGQPSSSSPRFRTLRTVHERYATALATALSAFLRSDFQASLQDLSVQTRGGFQATLPSPTCLMVFRLHPRKERMYLHLNCATVFGLLELLLGGKSGPDPIVPRNLTEIEWSLLEEVVRVMVRPLGEAWQLFSTVEFEVESLISEPGLLEGNDPEQPPTQPMIRLAFGLQYGEQNGVLELVVPQSLFDAAGESDQKSQGEGADPEVRQKAIRLKMALLEDASVSLEVRLEGPLLPVTDLMNLKPGQVIMLDYPLDQPLRGVVNGAVSLDGSVVSSGGKRAFHVVALP
ncbi:MAG TPA: flagellar motor switch protein FliM [Bryobacteraceae bacterium]|nr:flagellar motor switch protein FliM [Bryobacteraceae bacterium]